MYTFHEDFMGKSLCIIHANCQGDSLKSLLASTDAFSRKYTIEKYTNYLQEDVPVNSLENCALFLYQEIGPQWGEQATEALLQKLPAHCQCVQIPNMFFNGYWPLWTNKTHMAYGDMLLEHLCQGGLSARDILYIYLNGNLTSKYNLNALYDASRKKEEAKETRLLSAFLPEPKNHLKISSLHIIDEYWREEQLFYTVNHPRPRLLLYVANTILQNLHLQEVPATVSKAFSSLKEEFEQPIHPQVGKAFALPFVTEQRLYTVYGQQMTFAQYAHAYIQCRLQTGEQSIKDFVVYLHLLAQKASTHE